MVVSDLQIGSNMNSENEEYDFDSQQDVEDIDDISDYPDPWDHLGSTDLVGPDSFGGEDFPSDSTLKPYSFGGEDFPSDSPIQPLVHNSITHKALVDQGFNLGPIISPEDEALINNLYKTHPQLNGKPPKLPARQYLLGKDEFHPNEAWIQTYSGKRFNPTNPVPSAIVIQDIAHALSMQCRFSGHIKQFYSVAQHCVLVSHLCDPEDALWALLHDASEAYLIDIPRPLKYSGQFDAYKVFEENVQKAICLRFGLDFQEPSSVKRADTVMLATEARDLMSPLRSDWEQSAEPIPLKIVPLSCLEAKRAFLKRFFQLMGEPQEFEFYLANEHKY